LISRAQEPSLILDSVGHHRITVREADGRQHTLSAASDPDTSVHSRCPGVAAKRSLPEQIRAFEVTKKHTQRQKTTVKIAHAR